jgi:hypothetical protein
LLTATTLTFEKFVREELGVSEGATLLRKELMFAINKVNYNQGTVIAFFRDRFPLVIAFLWWSLSFGGHFHWAILALGVLLEFTPRVGLNPSGFAIQSHVPLGVSF